MTTTEFPKFPDVVKTLACPSCGMDRLVTIESLTGRARADITTNDIHYHGETQILWETTETIGVACEECSWSYVGSDWQDQLAVLGEEEEPEVHRYELSITVRVDDTNPEDAALKAAELLRTNELRFMVRDEHGYVGLYDAMGPLPPREGE